jgi:hypothetical protein
MKLAPENIKDGTSGTIIHLQCDIGKQLLQYLETLRV